MIKALPLAAAFLAGIVVCALTLRGVGTPAHAADAPAAKPDDLATLKAEVALLKGKATDQSHVMSDVAYHFSNLWFAAQNDNWPLAQFYADETRSHLRWAVRVIPMRKDRDGRDVDLKGILDALEQSSLKDLDQAVKARDKTTFTTAYKRQLENCMACHRAASKEYIHLHIPQRPDAGIVDFAPEPSPVPPRQ
jgi:hypothetical protein